MRTFHPSCPSAGNNVSATLVRQLIAEIRASRIISGKGLSVRRTPQGTHLSTKAERASGSLPRLFWVFSKNTDPESGETTCEWKNKFLQIGMRFHNFDTRGAPFTDSTDGSDGLYYVEIRLKENPISVEVKKGNFPAADPLTGKVYFELGNIKDGKQENTMPFVPVIYINL